MDTDSTSKRTENSSDDIEEDKNTCPSSRFAKRNYRKRSDSKSSTSSVPMEDAEPEQNNENLNASESNPNENVLQVH